MGKVTPPQGNEVHLPQQMPSSDFSFCRENAVGVGRCDGNGESAGTRTGTAASAFLRLSESSSLSAALPMVERFPRTFRNLLFVEAFVRYSGGLIVRRRADTPAAERAGDPGSVDRTSDSAVESRVEPEGQDLLDIQDMPRVSAPSCLDSLSGLNLSDRRPGNCGLTLRILPRVAHPYLYQAPQYQIAPRVCGEEILQPA